jgi:hypothetical protein
MKRNPNNWRWKLVLWLTGGVIHAVPLAMPGVHAKDYLEVTLGQPDHLNTAIVVRVFK